MACESIGLVVPPTAHQHACSSLLAWGTLLQISSTVQGAVWQALPGPRPALAHPVYTRVGVGV